MSGACNHEPVLRRNVTSVEHHKVWPRDGGGWEVGKSVDYWETDATQAIVCSLCGTVIEANPEELEWDT